MYHFYAIIWTSADPILWWIYVALGRKSYLVYPYSQGHEFTCTLQDHTRRHIALQWRHNGRNGVPNHQLQHCLLNRLFGHRWKRTSKLRVTGLCAGNLPVTGEFPAQMAIDAENVSIWWRHHGKPNPEVSTTEFRIIVPLWNSLLS